MFRKYLQHNGFIVVAFFIAIIMVGVVVGVAYKNKKKEIISHKEIPEKASISDALLLNTNLEKKLNVQKKLLLKQQTKDSLRANEVWFVPNGMSIPNYLLLASKEIDRCGGKIHFMIEIRDAQSALIKYEGKQGIYPLTEIRIVDSLWLPNSSKMAVVFAVRERNKLLKENAQMLGELNFDFNLLIPTSRKELLESAEQINANIIPWVPMQSSALMYQIEKNNQIPLGIIDEKLLNEMLDKTLEDFKDVKGFASFYGEDFLMHPASVDAFLNVVQKRYRWFWDLTDRGTKSLTLDKCLTKELKCYRNFLEAGSEKLIQTALKKARVSGSSVLFLELTENNIKLLNNLPELTEKQGTQITLLEEIF